jgi:hypothetical protein
MNEIKFQAIWGRSYFILGVLLGLLFIMSAIILNDYSILLYILAAALIIYIGKQMLSRSYALYNEREIKLMGHIGAIIEHYQFTDKKQITIRSNAVYLNGEKLKISSWMVDKQDWKRFIDFYDTDNAYLHELQDE